MQCAKAIGRKKEIRLSVLSAPAEDVDGLIEKLSSEFISPDASPDVIVWDYPVSFTNADIDRVSRLMDTADRWKSAVIAPLASQDAIFAGLDNKNDFAPLFQDVRYLHYKKLRSKLETRALCLCGPDMKLPDASEALNGAQGAFPASCCWPVMIRWIDRSAGNDDPFSLGSYSLAPETMLPDKAKFEFRISKAMSEEAAAIAGLTLFDGNPVGATPDRVRTVIEPEVAGHAYTSFLFNLLVNRVARLAGRRIGLFANAMNNQELAANVEALLRRELCAYNVCASLDQVSIKTEENGALAITLNSDEKVGGFPARFSFTLETQVTG